jgi:hypothetical protein
VTARVVLSLRALPESQACSIHPVHHSLGHASSDLMRRSARCEKGGASLQHPSWGGIDVRWESFPDRLIRVPLPIEGVDVPPGAHM